MTRKWTDDSGTKTQFPPIGGTHGLTEETRATATDLWSQSAQNDCDQGAKELHNMKQSQPVTGESFWDAGDMGCGELLIELKFWLQDKAPFAVVEVIALDSGAKEDMPAWCRLTGHRLLEASHPKYKIERRTKEKE